MYVSRADSVTVCRQESDVITGCIPNSSRLEFSNATILERNTTLRSSQLFRRVNNETTINTAKPNGIVTIPGWLNGTIACCGSI